MSGGRGTAAALACCCKSFEDPVLDALWEAQDQLRPLLKSIPGDVLDDKGGKWVSALMAFRSLPAKLFDWVVFQENPHQRGIGTVPQVRSKGPGAQSESISIPSTPRRSLGTAKLYPRHPPASGSEDLCMQRSDCGVHSVHLFVPLPENHNHRHKLRKIPLHPSYACDHLDNRRLFDKMSQPAKNYPTLSTEEPGHGHRRL